MLADPETPYQSLSEWQHRWLIELVPGTGAGDQVVPVTLTTEIMGLPYCGINEDGSDLRFAGADGNTLLTYWVELWDNRSVSRIWVRAPQFLTNKIYLYYGNPAATSLSAGSDVFAFFDDFQDGIWTKFPGNPVMTRTESWELRAICEPSVIWENGSLRMWYMGCSTSVGHNAAIGYATSIDGLNWTKWPRNPILREPGRAIIRPTVIKHSGTYYLFASDYQWNDGAGVISRWTSADGYTWSDEIAVLRPTEPWEGHYHNTGVVVDEDGIWHMLLNTDGPLAYAYSRDGLQWTKYAVPVIGGPGFVGGDPCLRKIGDKYFVWYSSAHDGHLRIFCSWSTDMVHWTEVRHNPQIGYTEPWERGIGRPEAHWDRHISDAELFERDGWVCMIYQGAQNPFGVALFNGDYAKLAARLLDPPLQQWAESPYGCVENNELKISDSETETAPVHEKTAQFSDTTGYVLEFHARCYAGASRQIKAIMRYVDESNYARFWVLDSDTTYYQERIDGQFGGAAAIGPNGIGDAGWHRWRIVVERESNRLYIDDRFVGVWQSGPFFVGRNDLKIGFSVYDTYASFCDVRVRALPSSDVEPRVSAAG